MHIKLHIQVNHDYSLTNCPFHLSVTPLTLTFFRSTIILVTAIHSTFFYVLLQNLYHISNSLIARMSSKFGKIRTETRSWRPKWTIIGHFFFKYAEYLENRTRSLDHYYKTNVQFQVGIYHEKFQHEKIQNGRPAATSDRQFVSLTRFTQHFFRFCSKIYTTYPFH